MISPSASSAAPVAPAVASDRARGRSRAGAPAETLPHSWDGSLDGLPRAMHRASVVAGVVILASVIVATLIAAHLGAHTLIYPQPVVQVNLLSAADADTAMHPGDALRFSARPIVGRDLAYTWDFGDGSLAKGRQPSHAYASYGYYAVTCEAVDPTGQRASAQLTVTVVPPAPRAAIAVSHDRAYDYMVSVDGSASTGVDLHYYWDFGDGASSNTGLTPQATHYYQHPGIYGLTLTVVDVAGQTNTTTVQVTISATAFH